MDNATVTQAVGKILNAALFTRANLEFFNYASTALDLTTTDSWSISVWVYPVGSFADYNIILNDLGTGDRKAYILTEPTTGNLTRFSGLASGVALTDSVWNHVAYTFLSQGTNTGIERLYLNGAQVGTRTGAVPAPGTNGIEIGRDTAIGNHFIDGRLDEYGYWRRALTAAEVAQLYGSGNGLAYPLTIASGSGAVPMLMRRGGWL